MPLALCILLEADESTVPTSMLSRFIVFISA
jgi:hypothetical protein